MRASLNSRGAGSAPRAAAHLKMNLKKQQLQNEHFMQIEHDNQLLMKKIYQIMNDAPVESAREYMPGVRLNKNQRPIVDCHMNLATPTIIPGRAVPLKSLNFEASERLYNKHVEENVKMMKRLKENKPTYQRKEWSLFATKQAGYSRNSRNRDLTAGHLPQKKTRFKAPKKQQSTLNPSHYGTTMSRSRLTSPSPKKTHTKHHQNSQSVLCDAETVIDGTSCNLLVSELCTSYHSANGGLTHGTTGLLVEVSSEGGKVKGHACITIPSLQTLCRDIQTLKNLKALPDRLQLFPKFESCLTAEEEEKVVQKCMDNTYVSNQYEGGQRKFKVTVGHSHTAQIQV
ncbi:hypothetical protein TL16_g11156 [Triparma laevis f. inornata]|uniref:Uncharacterized protein n=2 Tax=Triparma laevis TaxID=1534972 RepID=A0A9W7AFC4_9STRA|nr:hypothetical protein TrLO_g5581 [Triparma laevis f. longispina]GMH88432.1 hypothetical protein TL16_g11156 [Triparma laevis f. inornata]